VWAFGVMLYEMLTGDHPIPGLPAGSDQDVTNLIRRHDIIPIQQKRRDIPEGLVSLITEMLDKNKSRRINNFETVSRRLRNIYRNHTQHNLPTYDHPSEAHTQSLGMRSLLKEMVRQGSKNENKE
ncbi:MAG: protein kinase, partial [Anaerolineae bacterium]|nr:protein kinase [Anaerolineae bacterium]